MKTSNHRLLIQCMGVGICLLQLLVASTPADATIFAYDASRFGTLPTNQGWTLAGSQIGSQSIQNGQLIVTDASNSSRSFAYSTNAVGQTFSSSTEWQVRSLVRIEGDYVGTAGLYNQYVSDNYLSGGFSGRYISSGVGSNEFGLFGSATSQRVFVPAGPYYEVVVTKTNGANLAAHGIQLQVYDATGATLFGTITRPYTPGGEPGFGNLGQIAEFGGFAGSPTGTFDLKWATFGINEAAPFLVPEPSTVVLLGVGGLLMWRRGRNWSKGVME